MPLSTTFTFGWEATQRTAQEATLLSGAAFLNISVMSSENPASRPPLTGSMITIGIPFSSARRYPLSPACTSVSM